MIARIIEGRGKQRRVVDQPLKATDRQSMAEGLCQYLNIKSK